MNDRGTSDALEHTVHLIARWCWITRRKSPSSPRLIQMCVAAYTTVSQPLRATEPGSGCRRRPMSDCVGALGRLRRNRSSSRWSPLITAPTADGKPQDASERASHEPTSYPTTHNLGWVARPAGLGAQNQDQKTVPDVPDMSVVRWPHNCRSTTLRRSSRNWRGSGPVTPYSRIATPLS